MGIVTISMDDEVERKLRTIVKGKRALGKAITSATKEWLEKQKQELLKKKLADIMRKGWPMGKILVKKREELYDR